MSAVKFSGPIALILAISLIIYCIYRNILVNAWIRTVEYRADKREKCMCVTRTHTHNNT